MLSILFLKNFEKLGIFFEKFSKIEKKYLDVEESSLEMRFVQIESLHGACFMKQIIDEEIDSQSWGSSKNCGQSKGNTIGFFENGIFTTLFGFTIERNGITWSILIADTFDNTIA